MLRTLLFFAAVAASTTRDLPLIEVASTSSPAPMFAVLLTGDGGWAAIDRSIAANLSAHGVPVAGLNSLKYFMGRRTPDQVSRDLAEIIRNYRAKWGRPQVVLIGYSRGADVLPFAVSRLPRELRDDVRLVALLAPSRTASFEFHLTDWLGASHGELPTLEETRKLRGMRLLCVRGDEETDSLCTELDPALAQQLVLRGGHHFGGSYEAIADRILAEARR